MGTNSEVTLTVEFRADSLPIVTWFRETFDTGVETNLSNSSFYTIIGPVETEMENMFRVSTVYMCMYILYYKYLIYNIHVNV